MYWRIPSKSPKARTTLPSFSSLPPDLVNASRETSWSLRWPRAQTLTEALILEWTNPTRPARLVIGAPPQRFETEDAAREHLVAILFQHFTLIPEVWMQHPLKAKPIRLDYVAIAKADSGFPKTLVGIEVKPRYGSFGEFARALAQSIDYRHSIICDQRAVKHKGEQLPYVFLYPPLSTRDGWVDGAVRVAGKFNVGVIVEERPYWGSANRVRFEVSGERYWSSDYGARGGASAWGNRSAQVGRRG